MDNDTNSTYSNNGMNTGVNDGSQAGSQMQGRYDERSDGGTHVRPDAPELMRRVVQGAHETIDHLADVAAPRVQKLQQGVDGAGEMLHERAEQLRTLQEEWKTSLRGTVRQSPLTAVATALVLGMLVARITR